jgi:large conductance mechanosensitive channel
VILGGAFGKIVESLVSDVITPALLSPALQSAKVEDLAKLSFNGILYGKFLAAVLNFLLIAFVIYLGVRTIEALRRRLQTDPSAVASTQERLVASLERLTEVLDSISNSQN